MGGAVAAHGDDQPFTGGGGIVSGITAAASLDHLEIEAGTGARSGAPFPETTSPATAGRRVEDDERPVRPQVADDAPPRIRLAFSTSFAICCCNAGTVANRFSARSRWTNDTVSSLSYRSPSKSSRNTSTVSVFPPKVGRKPTLSAPGHFPNPCRATSHPTHTIPMPAQMTP